MAMKLNTFAIEFVAFTQEFIIVVLTVNTYF